MSSPRRTPGKLLAAIVLLGTALTAHATLPEWLQHVVGASSIEAALFRAMALPGLQALYPRPPKEAVGEVSRLIAATPDDAALYTLRASSDEASLDFTAAESDWKLAVSHAKDPINQQLQLADFYHRRMMVTPEFETLAQVASAPPLLAERFLDPARQRSWLAYERELALAADQGLPPEQTTAVLQAFITRYPDQPAVYARSLEWHLQQKDWPAAQALIDRYHAAFPHDEVFPIRARALVEYRRGNVDRALAVYDAAFQPLWPAPLVQSYFGLLDATHRQRAFVADARTRLAEHPDGPDALNALARIFYYDQQAGRLDKAQQTIDAFRINREARNAAWTPVDLATLAALTNATHSYAESARYHFALASSSGSLPSAEPAAQAGLSGLVHLLLTAPDQPIALGAGNLSLYRDIATLDQGPGYWNGILSLWLNGTSPEREYQSETAKAQGYFHRAKAAELLTDLDQRFPQAPLRPSLHAELVRTYAQYGEADAVVAAGKDFLANFPNATDRVEVAGLIADAYARQQNPTAEFALYDSLLAELAAKTGGLPLTAGAASHPPDPQPGIAPNQDAEPTDPAAEQAPLQTRAAMKAASYELSSYTPITASIPEAAAYARILDRYVSRLVAEQKIPQALLVLRHQLDLNPDDPLLYERLASFLQQNNLSAQQEAIFKLAIAHFQQPTWYDKLARLYLRERNREAYAALTHQVTDIFAGTELDQWFHRAGNLAQLNQPNQRPIGPQLALQLNLYAQKRFPHDLVFTRNILHAYDTDPTLNRAAYEDALRHHWWESADLRNTFFAYLSRTGKLQSELAQLQTLAASTNPAATRELAEADVWTSHFEQAAPLMGSIAELYPADTDTGDGTISLFRSLAYLDSTPASTTRAVAIEQHLLAAEPDSPNRLATLGDLYAEATSTGGEDLASATPYWRKIPSLHAGTPAGFLNAATIFWDYFQFDDALAQLTAARTHFHQPALLGYEAGAIQENRRDLPAAIREYTAVAVHPPDEKFFMDSLNAALGAYFKPPSDAGDSDFRSTAQSLFNSAAARDRLLQLAARPATATLVDQATAQAVSAGVNRVALTLRADVLLAQHRPAELAPLLEQALARATSPDDAAAIGDLARTHSQSPLTEAAQLREVDVNLATSRVAGRYAPAGSYSLTPVYEHALERQIALTSDPVEKIQLSYTLASSLESRKDLAGAARIVDAVYRANPRTLGVVRATTDFYLRTSQPPRAIATLIEASKAATPQLARSFTLEAAQRANDAGDPAQARKLAETLLPQTPYDATVLGIIAASYARANDDAGLKAFYVSQLAAVKTAALTPEERRANTALLRRGLIPALTRLKDYPGAIDQYIALLSAYPEDATSAQEAALYALRYSRQPQLLDFLRTTVKQSPRDSRFAILLAQTDVTLEDFPGAIAAYTQAIAIRKDRADLYTARADLELRLNQDEPAAEDFARLYVLSYKDPAWMVRLAELRARQQRPDDAVKALTTAYITGQPPSAANAFRVADQLSRWNLLTQARTFAEQGVTLAGPQLLTPPNAGGATTYARIMAQLGKPDEALTALSHAFTTLDSSPVLSAQLGTEFADAGVSASDLAKARQQYALTRRQTAQTQLQQAVLALGEVIEKQATPEQKLAFAQALDRLHDPSQPAATRALALAAATSGGLADREAAWRRQQLLTGPIDPATPPDASAYIALQRRRLAFAELAQTLEAFAPRLPSEARSNILRQAAQAWRDAGDETNELRVTRPLVLAQDAALRDRFLDLLLRHDRAALTALAANRNDTLANAAVDYAVGHAPQAQALAAVTQRSRALPPVWRPALASLILTNFANAATPPAIDDFTQSLNWDAPIAARIAKPADPAKQLTGTLWFYYAGRFGLFLNTVAKSPSLPDLEDFLPAELEQAPTLPAGYLHLARDYADAGNAPASAIEYSHALELAPNNPAVHDEFAVVLYRASHREEALAHWRTALDLMRRRQSGEEFFAAFKSLTAHLAERHLATSLRPEIESVLKPYFARNGNYRSNELLQAAYTSAASDADGTALILTASSAASNPEQVLDDLDHAAWLTPQAAQTILLRRLELARQASPSSDSTDDFRLSRITTIQVELLRSYLNLNQEAQAQSLIDSIPAQDRKGNAAIEKARIVLAAHAGRLEATLAAFRTAPDQAPEISVLQQAANELAASATSRKPDPTSARSLREYVFEQKQLAHQLLPTDFLALAQSRLDTADLAGALTLLHRLALQPPAPAPTTAYGVEPTPPDPYANTDSAAALLEAAKRPSDALPFLNALVRAVPWDATCRLRLAEAQLKSGGASTASASLLAVLRDASAPYATRVLAAKDLAAMPSPAASIDAGSAELTLLASTPHPSPAQARTPYFVAARLAASVTSPKSDRTTLLREAIAIDPNNPTADHARLDLLLAQDNTANPSITLALFNALADRPPSNSDVDSDPPTPSPQDDEPAQQESSPPPATLTFPLANTLDLPTRIHLATLLSSAYQRDHDLTQAAAFQQLAIHLDAASPGPDPTLAKRLADLQIAIRLERQNAARRPSIHNDLYQTNQVRPRLTVADLARAEAP